VLLEDVGTHITEAECLKFVFTKLARSVKKVLVRRLVRIALQKHWLYFRLSARRAGTCSLLLIRAVTPGLNYCLRMDKCVTAWAPGQVASHPASSLT